MFSKAKVNPGHVNKPNTIKRKTTTNHYEKLTLVSKNVVGDTGLVGESANINLMEGGGLKGTIFKWGDMKKQVIIIKVES